MRADANAGSPRLGVKSAVVLKLPFRLYEEFNKGKVNIFTSLKIIRNNHYIKENIFRVVYANRA